LHFLPAWLFLPNICVCLLADSALLTAPVSIPSINGPAPAFLDPSTSRPLSFLSRKTGDVLDELKNLDPLSHFLYSLFGSLRLSFLLGLSWHTCLRFSKVNSISLMTSRLTPIILSRCSL
jgi:hypothetical protein